MVVDLIETQKTSYPLYGRVEGYYVRMDSPTDWQYIPVGLISVKSMWKKVTVNDRTDEDEKCLSVAQTIRQHAAGLQNEQS